MKFATLAAIATVMLLNVVPADAKNEHGRGGDRDRQDGRSGGGSIEIRISPEERGYIHDYYSGRITQGHCPPGLAKKHNGCMPPGQAKKWAKGRPLPRDVVYYDLPRELAMRITPPPAGYRYVRVASDILMIAIGSGMVVDAIEDLVRL